MDLSLVVAVSDNNVIGRNNRLPWRLPGELQYFRRITLGKPVIMGRKTWESLKGPLPGRLNLVVTRQEDYVAPGATVVHSLDQALGAARASGAGEAMLIGGAALFAEGMSRASRLYLTEVHGQVEGDTFFPPLDRQSWEEVTRERATPTERDQYAYSMVVYRRI